MSEIETIIAAGAAAGVLMPALVVLLAFVTTRIYFGGYVRRKHPEVWDELVQKGNRLNIVSLKLSFDATPEFAEFRASTDDLGDLEVAARRRIANRLERLCVVSFICGAVWIVISAVAIGWLSSR